MIDNRPPKLGQDMLKRFAVAAIVIIALAGISTATAALMEVQNYIDIIDEEGGPNARLDLGDDIDRAEAGDPQTILLLGSDKRFTPEDKGVPPRSDTIMLVRLDPDRDFISAMSIPRDLLVSIPGHGRDKINAAYSTGGPSLTLRTVKALIGQEEINHVINVNFGGFERAIDFLGCVFVDVDRRYFNNNTGGGEKYDAIDVKAGYQRLCGSDALDYVRYRHEDNDLIRAARQQDFLRQAKDQYGVQRLFDDREELARIFGRYTQTDKSLENLKDTISFLKAGIFSAGKPVQEVRFPALLGDPDDPYVRYRQSALDRALRQFLKGESSSRATGSDGGSREPAAERNLKKALRETRRSKKKRDVGNGLVDARVAAEDQGITIQTKIPDLPVFYPRYAPRASRYLYSRAYKIGLRDGTRYSAYRMTGQTDEIGEYYGIQGMSWRNPPILKDPSQVRRIGKRKFMLFYDGPRLRLIAWRTRQGAYWISNTLTQHLTTKQMIAMARSVRAFGS